MPKYETRVRVLTPTIDLVAGVHDLPKELGDKLVSRGKAARVSDLDDEARDAAEAESERAEADKKAAEAKRKADAEKAAADAKAAIEKAAADEAAKTSTTRTATKTTPKS